MKNKWITPVIVIIGIGTLFFFPEPQTNFIWYLATAIGFIISIILSAKMNY